MSSYETASQETLEQLLHASSYDRDRIIALLSASGDAAWDAIRTRAYDVKCATVGPTVYLRGLVEITNRCAKNCSYCGLRRDLHIERYSMSKTEVMDCIRWIAEAEYGSVVLQGGERHDPGFVSDVEKLIIEIRRVMGTGFGITLSFGEHTRETYTRWRNAGADRYLLRMETTNYQLYRRIHPTDHSFATRVVCIRELKRLGYQLGSGVMIGLPGQKIQDLADDLLFLRDIDVDMIGMGPYLVHRETPMGAVAVDTPFDRDVRLAMALRMIAVARIVMPDVNIAASTALQALHPWGRELGLMSGANVIMPAVTPKELRKHYLLYDGRPSLDSDAAECRDYVTGRVQALGERVALGERGDSLHARRKHGGH